jgi:hypothetical protein
MKSMLDFWRNYDNFHPLFSVAENLQDEKEEF